VRGLAPEEGIPAQKPGLGVYLSPHG